MSLRRIILCAALALVSFAGNSLLCRMALRNTTIDAATFTTVRLISGAAVLALCVRLRSKVRTGDGNWLSAAALFLYAAGFSFAYRALPASTGALLLFGSVQTTMIGYGLFRGERLRLAQAGGLLFAVGGLVLLFLPGLSAPPLLGSLLMLAAGVSWGVYSLRGRSGGDPTRVTAGNFLRAVPFSLLLSLLPSVPYSVDTTGTWLAVASGALTSGLGYVLWYSVLPALRATTAATLQLSVPVLTTAGGGLLLGEPLSPRLVLASLAIIGGITLVILKRR